jgi:hypothetical protein
MKIMITANPDRSQFIICIAIETWEMIVELGVELGL